MRNPMRGIDEWITRDNRIEIPESIWWVDGHEDAGSFVFYDEAMDYVLEFGDMDMREFPEDYIYSEQPEY